jgi:hypothetical protein
LCRNRRAAGAPLTVILRGETMPGTEDGPLAAFAWRGARCSVTAGHHRPGGSGDSRLASAAAPGSVRTREGAAVADALGADSPRLSGDAIGLVVLPVSVHAFPPGQLASSALLPGCGPALACRRRALEAVEKVVAFTPACLGVSAVLRRVMRDTRPRGDLRQSRG